MAKAVLYSLWKKTMTKTVGMIEDDKPKIPGACNLLAYRNFYTIMRNEAKDRRTVSPQEGYIYNKCLWLSKADDDIARKAFIEYEKNCIADLQKRISAHQELIDILEKDAFETVKEIKKA